MMLSQKPKLSICIATFNRADFLAQTLDRIARQATGDCEIVIADNASTDRTRDVVARYAETLENLKYVRQDSNLGPDRNFDAAVCLASGEYCWLMPDDDLLKPGAVGRVLAVMQQHVSLIVANVEFRDLTMSRVIQRGALSCEVDHVYESNQLDSLFQEAGTLLGYVGSVIIKRSIWMERDRGRYADSGHIYLGVIFQKKLPGRAVVIGDPLIEVRLGNIQEWWSKIFEIYMNGPSVVESFDLPESIKRSVCEVEAWKRPYTLFWLRALGVYSVREYLKWVRPRLRSRIEALVPATAAVVPSSLLNIAFSLYYRTTRRSRDGYSHGWILEVLKQARSQRLRVTG